MFVELSNLNKKYQYQQKNSKLLKTEAIFYSIGLCNKTHPYAWISLFTFKSSHNSHQHPSSTCATSAVSVPITVCAFVQNTSEFPISMTFTSWIYYTAWGKIFLLFQRAISTPMFGVSSSCLWTTRLKPSQFPIPTTCTAQTPLHPIVPFPHPKSLLSICSSFPVPDPFPHSSLSASLHSSLLRQNPAIKPWVHGLSSWCSICLSAGSCMELKCSEKCPWWCWILFLTDWR